MGNTNADSMTDFDPRVDGFDLQLFADGEEPVMDDGEELTTDGDMDGDVGEPSPEPDPRAEYERMKAEFEDLRSKYDHGQNELGELRKVREEYDSVKDLKEIRDFFKKMPKASEEFNAWYKGRKPYWESGQFGGSPEQQLPPALMKRIEQLESMSKESLAMQGEREVNNFKKSHPDVDDKTMNSILELVTKHNFETLDDAYDYSRRHLLREEGMQAAMKQIQEKKRNGILADTGGKKVKAGKQYQAGPDGDLKKAADILGITEDD